MQQKSNLLFQKVNSELGGQVSGVGDKVVMELERGCLISEHE